MSWGALTLEPPTRCGYELSLHTCHLANCTVLGLYNCEKLPSQLSWSFPASPSFLLFFPSLLSCFPDLTPGPDPMCRMQISLFIFLLELHAMDVSPRLHGGDIWHTAAGLGSTSLVLSSGFLSSHLYHLYDSPRFYLGHCCCLGHAWGVQEFGKGAGL